MGQNKTITSEENLGDSFNRSMALSEIKRLCTFIKGCLARVTIEK